VSIPPYRYWPITERPPVTWPGDRGLAVYIGLNIEHFHPGRPATSVSGLTAALPVDPMNHGWRDYGTRVGIWRMIELLDQLELPASALVNSEVCEHYPQIVAAGRERGWAWVAHGTTNSQLWTGLEPTEERALLAQIVTTLSDATGRRPRGWLGPALTETDATLSLLAELGFTYTLDWVADDQPVPLQGLGAPFASVPYSMEVNDIPAVLERGFSGAQFGQLIVDQFDLMRAESARRPGGVFGIALHPFLVNQPTRHRYLAEALAHVAGHDDVWLTTSDAIADWYVEHHHDRAVAVLDQLA
jgi:allantoinase